MKRGYFIRNFYSAVLLFVFAFAVTPKQYLHDAIAKHRHQAEKHRGDVHVENKTFICYCDNQVAESPFIPNEAITIEATTNYFLLENFQTPTSPLLSSASLDFLLRGPPSVV